MLSSSGPFTLRKLREHSVATALARRVLPTPGGPYLRGGIEIMRGIAWTSRALSNGYYMRMPDLLIPALASPMRFIGIWMVSRISPLASSRPPEKQEKDIVLIN